MVKRKLTLWAILSSGEEALTPAWMKSSFNHYFIECLAFPAFLCLVLQSTNKAHINFTPWFSISVILDSDINPVYLYF